MPVLAEATEGNKRVFALRSLGSNLQALTMRGSTGFCESSGEKVQHLGYWLLDGEDPVVKMLLERVGTLCSVLHPAD